MVSFIKYILKLKILSENCTCQLILMTWMPHTILFACHLNFTRMPEKFIPGNPTYKLNYSPTVYTLHQFEIIWYIYFWSIFLNPSPPFFHLTFKVTRIWTVNRQSALRVWGDLLWCVRSQAQRNSCNRNTRISWLSWIKSCQLTERVSNVTNVKQASYV